MSDVELLDERSLGSCHLQGADRILCKYYFSVNFAKMLFSLSHKTILLSTEFPLFYNRLTIYQE